MPCSLAWFYATASVTAKANASTVAVLQTSLGGINIGVSTSNVTELHLTDSSGNEKAWNPSGLATIATYASSGGADGGHKTSTLTVNTAVTVSETNYPALTADQLKPYQGNYTLTLTSASTTNSVADGSSRLRLSKTESGVYSGTVTLSIAIQITSEGLISIESGDAALTPTYSIWVSANGGDANQKDFDTTNNTNYTVAGSITPSGLAGPNA